MTLKLGKNKALPAAPAKNDSPSKPRKEKNAKAAPEADEVDNGVVTLKGAELKDIVAGVVVTVLADIFGQLAERVNNDSAGDGDTEADPEVEDEVEETKPAGKKGKAGKKAKPAPEPDPEDEDEDEDEDEEVEDDPADEADEAADDEYDPNPFAKKFMKVAKEAVEELETSTKDMKETLSAYLEDAPEGAPATVKIKSLFKSKKIEDAYLHLVALLVDDNGNVHDFGDVYVRNESYVYLGGVEGIEQENEGFSPVAKAKLISLEDGSESKAPKNPKFSSVLHNPINGTYFGVNEDDGTAIQVEPEDD